MPNNLNEKQYKPKLSVVVIAFNNELYIEEALESLHEQTFEDLEIVVVNDHSSDSTGEKIDQFIKDKPKFKAIHLEENSGGCSVPRNTGVANTTGEYVMFLDGDDWYTVDACEKMVAAIERTGSDFVGGQTIRTNNYETWYYNQIYSKERTNINVREFSIMLFDSLSVNKIYKRAFLEENNLSFPEGIHYEDVVFTGKAYFLADSISIIPEPVYYWRVVEDPGDQVKSITNRRDEFENFANRIKAHRMFDDFLKKKGDVIYQKNKNNKFLRHDLKLYTNDYLELDDEYKKKFHTLIQEYMHEVMDIYEFLSLPERERTMYYLLYIGDEEAFQDYISYINGLPTKERRVYAKGDRYYFHSSLAKDIHLKFLRIEEPVISFTIKEPKLTDKLFSFQAEAELESIQDPESITYLWMLKNRLTESIITARASENPLFALDDVEPGNYYLSLLVNHKGNMHKRLVKKENIEHLPNTRVEDEKFAKALFINQKNSFAVKVSPLKNFDKVKWGLKKRVNIDTDKKKRSEIYRSADTFSRDMIQKLGINDNLVLFESHMGKQYSDSPKYIYEELYRARPELKFVWSFENPEAVEVPGPAVKVKRGSLQHAYYMARAKYWVDNQGMAHLSPKKDEQVYLQTWHGTPLKKMGHDQKRRLTEDEIARLRMQASAWDYFVSPNEYSTKIFKKAFRYGGEIIESGYPRNDLLVKQPSDIAAKVKNRLYIGDSKKVVLYAPTFRDWEPDSFNQVQNDIQKLSKELNNDTVLLLRLHYTLSNKVSFMDLPKNIINVSSYGDIQELYLITDILITDYSSVMFDFATLKRPIILYCYDLEEYLSRRGMYFDLKERAPGPICKQVDEVIHYINNPETLKEYNPKLEQFAADFTSLEDGKAAREVIDRVFD